MLLHILNGDGLKMVFEKGNLKGDRLIWRELMSEGPVSVVGSPEKFWQSRREFIAAEYDPGGTYDEKVLQEFKKLDHLHKYQEVCLWFEHDLVCQINLIFVLSSILEKVRKPLRVSLVSMNSHPEVPGFRGLAQLSPAQLRAAFQQRITLVSGDLRFATQVWLAYAQPDPKDLLELQMQPHPKFPYLTAAITAHFSRFPSAKNGLNAIEETLLNLVIDQNGEMPQRHLIRDFLLQDEIFGCGDMMVERYARALSPDLLVFEAESVRITQLGKAVLAGELRRGER